MSTTATRAQQFREFAERGDHQGFEHLWLERLDEHYELMPEQAERIDRKPSEYFLDGRAWVATEPDERSLPYVVERLGSERILYASDYYHWDCAFPDSVKLLAERSDLDPAAKTRILGGNAAELYGF